MFDADKGMVASLAWNRIILAVHGNGVYRHLNE